MASNRALEQKSEIIGALQYFDVSAEVIASASTSLQSAESISIPAYLEEYLIPHINVTALYASAELADKGKVNELHKMCFTGYLSEGSWDRLWKNIHVRDQQFYATTDNAGNPLELAVKNNNMPALRRLDSIYQTITDGRYNDRKLRNLKNALIAITRPGAYRESQSDSCDYLLKMCEKYLTVNNVSLVEVFSEPCRQGIKGYIVFNAGLMQAMEKMCDYVCQHASPGDFEQFKGTVVSQIQERIISNSGQSERERLGDADISRLEELLTYVSSLTSTAEVEVKVKEVEVKEVEVKEVKVKVKEDLGKLDEAMNKLDAAIHAMKAYGETLRGEGATKKGDRVVELSEQLLSKKQNLYSPKDFDDFNTLLNSKNKEMKEYRVNWGTIIKNIAIALTGVGALLMAGKLIHSAVTTKDHRPLFFGQQSKTTSEEKLEAVKEAFKDLPSPGKNK